MSVQCPAPRQRQDPLLDVAVVDGVVDADEVEGLAAHDALQLLVLRLGDVVVTPM
jgi:hypothetical protein